MINIPTTTVKFNGIDYTIKKSFRSLNLFETLANKSITSINDSMTDMLLLFYCIIKSNNSFFKFDFDQFIDLLDDNPVSFKIFIEYLESQSEKVSESSTTNKKKVK